MADYLPLDSKSSASGSNGTTSDRPRYRSMAHAITCNWDQLQSTKLTRRG
ncbi:hypothetical protein [Trichocoleus sp. FACHB-262]|nr:hypothetical protein [Trichocoleus sp. FACHB-262]MBD2121309.1 hypothetical protein [Trichocoleus sp. FACHB-262]